MVGRVRAPSTPNPPSPVLWHLSDDDEEITDVPDLIPPVDIQAANSESEIQSENADSADIESNIKADATLANDTTAAVGVVSSIQSQHVVLNAGCAGPTNVICLLYTSPSPRD